MARKKKVKMTWREAWPVWMTLAGLSALGVFGAWLYYVPPAKKTPPLQVTTEDVVFSLASLDATRPRLFSYPFEGSTNVELFARKAEGSRVQVAFASCRKCYRAGHLEQGNQVMCGRCNVSMDLLREGQSPGGESDCGLISIPYEQENGQILIRGRAIRDTFDHWYRPALAASGN